MEKQFVTDLPPGTWAKIHREHDRIIAWCPLDEHCLDVAAVTHALLRIDCLRHRISTLSGIPELCPGQCDRLAVLAGTHDLGKLNHGFQAKADPKATHTAGHVKELAAIVPTLLRGPGGQEIRRIIEAAKLLELARWFESEDALLRCLLATWCHHGRLIEKDAVFRADLWRNRNGINPIQAIESVMDRLFAEYPEIATAPPLPDKPELAHAFMGLVTLADWIASDVQFFPLFPIDTVVAERKDRSARAEQALCAIGIDVDHWRKKTIGQEFNFVKIFGRTPRPAQEEMLQRTLPSVPSILALEADTGSGKTEAVLVWFARLFAAGQVDGLYFALPTRAAATQIYRRVCTFANRWLGSDHPPVILAVPGYLSVDGREGQFLPGFEVLWPDSEEDRFHFRTWAGEHPKRYFAGSIVIGTVDQVLLSALQVSHSHMRGTSLLRHLLVVDEVHSSDAYMTRIIEEVVRRTEKAGGHILLMSATLGGQTCARLLRNNEPEQDEAESIPYPCLSVREGKDCSLLSLGHHAQDRRVEVQIEHIMADAERIAVLALDAAQKGARVAVIRNTVSGVIALQEALEAIAPRALLFLCRGIFSPHHGRYARADRRLLDQALEERLKQNLPVVIAATQTIEQSLDIDFDLLITDLCPMDVLIQRLGRLHRHKRDRSTDFVTPRVIVLIPEQPLESFLGVKGDAHGPNGIGTVYEDLGILEATFAMLCKTPVLELPRNNRILVERTTHPALLDQRARLMGPAWCAHRQNIWGVALGQRNVAGMNVFRWHEPLETISAKEPGLEIMTRLGEKDRLVRLDNPQPGPFGEPVNALTIPGHIARQLTDPDKELIPEGIEALSSGGFSFELGGVQFVYNRLGLQRKDKG